MNLYLAGTASAGNNSYIWKNDPKRAMELFLSAPHSNNMREGMDLYLAGTHAESNRANAEGDFAQKIFVLESFFYVADWMIPYIRNHWSFMLDSGAFTFMQNSKKTADWDEYVERYAKFVLENDIELFFELDIDSVVGIKKVEQLRERLHRLTNRVCIPVWHRSRGLDYWISMCKHYDYVAIGGIVSGEIKKNEFPIFYKLLKIAREHDCKVHGLGFTNIDGLRKYKFDSVDSTAWIYGNMSGYIYQFNGKEIIKSRVPEGMRLNSKAAAIHNFREWVKFQRYAKLHL